MSSEISLLGEIPTDFRQKIVDRLAAHSHGCYTFETKEVVYDRGPVQENPEDGDLLRLRHTSKKPERTDIQGSQTTGWTMNSLGRLEPERLSPEFLIRPVTMCPVTEGDVFEFASALGYRRKFEFLKRGIAFERGIVTAEIYQVHADAISPPIAGSDSYIISLTAITPAPVQGGPTVQELREQAFAAVREFQRELRGLVDLTRIEP